MVTPLFLNLSSQTSVQTQLPASPQSCLKVLMGHLLSLQALDSRPGFSCLAVPGGSGPRPVVSSPVEVTSLPIGPPLPPARAQRYLRSAEPAAQGFLRTLRNVGTCVFPPRLPRAVSATAGGSWAQQSRQEHHPPRPGEESWVSGRGDRPPWALPQKRRSRPAPSFLMASCSLSPAPAPQAQP